MAKMLKTKDNYSPQPGANTHPVRTLLVTLVLPALVVVGVLMLLSRQQGGIEAGLANLALLLPVGFAFSAGMVASVNPCGVVMLTSYAFQRMDGARQKPIGWQVLESVTHALAITLSFAAIFVGVGALISGRPNTAGIFSCSRPGGGSSDGSDRHVDVLKEKDTQPECGIKNRHEAWNDIVE